MSAQLAGPLQRPRFVDPARFTPQFGWRKSAKQSGEEVFSESVSLVEAAEKFGTPAYVYSRAAIETAFGALRKGLGALPHTLCFAVKSNGNLTIQTNNDNASQQIGSLAGSTGLFSGKTAPPPVADPIAQATRAGLISQFNNILSQITTTAQDSSFNGVNLLNGDSLKLVFNEINTSTLTITGATFDAPGLGLSNLVAGTDFIDNAATNKVLNVLNVASSTLRSEASTLGSNLSVVQIRQDFNKNLINVLQTGSSNLTLADPNEEAANSQALSTRQSIAVSALALANQSQQSVLQLLR